MSKVWAYVIPRRLEDAQLDELQKAGAQFVSRWTAHDNPLDASFEIIEGRIIVVKVNEKTYAASGCSIDKLQRFMKEAGAGLGTDLLDRMQVPYEHEGKLEVAHSSAIRQLLAEGKLQPGTITYDLTVSSGEELKGWKKPLEATWLRKFLTPRS